MTREDSEDLYNRLFKTVTKHFPMEPMTVRTDLVMELYQDFHKWATGEPDEKHGIDADALTVDVDVLEYVEYKDLPPGTVIG